MANLAYWGHWAISLFVAENYGSEVESFFGEISFPVGPQGPVDGLLGSPERRRYEDAIKQWAAGECPQGAWCPLGQKWLYGKESK